MNLDYIIVEDDPMARRLLQRYCQKVSTLHFKGAFANVLSALDFLEQDTTDLLFLDIEMPDYSGIELLNQTPILPLTIFTTAKANYAYAAFEYEAIDYLKKPFSFLRFQKAVDKAIRVHNADISVEKRESNDIYIKDNGRLTKIDLSEVLYFESDADYIHIKTIDKKFTINGALKSLEKKLPSANFAKVHRSFIVNLEQIIDIEDSSLLIDKKVIPISRRNRTQLFNKLNII